MNFKYLPNRIEIRNKVINKLDEFVFDFILLLNKQKIKYVLVSGYVSILFGRNRTSEDVDIFIEKMDYTKFYELWTKISKKFECLNTSDVKNAYEKYLSEGISLRFSKKNSYIPNIEFKFPKLEIDYWTLEKRIEVTLNDYKLFISPLELQIPFKLFLGSQKDIEDARHLYKLFKEHLNLKLLDEFNQKLKTDKLFNKYIK